MAPPAMRPPEIYSYDQFYKLTTPVQYFGRVRDLDLLRIDRRLQTHDWAQQINNPRMMRGAVQQIIDACIEWLEDYKNWCQTAAQYGAFDQPGLRLRYDAVHSLWGKADELRQYYEKGESYGVEWPDLPAAGGLDDVKVLVTGHRGLMVRVIDAVPLDTQGQLRPFAVDTRDCTMWMGLQPVQEVLAQHNILRINLSNGVSEGNWAPYFGTIKATKGRVDLIQNGSRDNYLYSLGCHLWGAAALSFTVGLDLTSAIAVLNNPTKPTGNQQELQPGSEWFSMHYNAAQLALSSGDGTAQSIRTTRWKAPGGPGDMLEKTGLI